MKNIKNHILKINETLKYLNSKEIDLEKIQKNSRLIDYSSQKYKLYFNQLTNSVKYLQNNISSISLYFDMNKKDQDKKNKFIEVINKLNLNDLKQLETDTQILIEEVSEIDIKERKRIKVNTSKIPLEIRSEVLADINEMNKCFDANCYRSVVILCGRIIEVLLHRKYYDATGMDILEKNPGIGLGKLIAKLTEKGIELQPGLTHQIHLINQVRIFSVHKKQTCFNPSESQTHAIILFLADTIDKLY